MLHGYMISSLILMPFGGQCRADEPEDVFTLTGYESQVVVSVSAPDGTTGLLPGATRQVQISVQRHTWDVWTKSVSGTIELRDERITPVSASLNYYGSVSPGMGTTDANGLAATTFTMGTAATTVMVEATYHAGAVAVGTLDFSAPDPEVWTFDHDESLLFASMKSTGTTGNVSRGETRPVELHVEYASWSVYTSNWGNTETRGYAESPASGAQISWSVVSGGDGSLNNGSTITDGSGNATVTFTMGTTASDVRADVIYGGSRATNASIGFTPAPVVEEWSFFENQTSRHSVALIANGPTDGVLPGAQRTLTATVLNYVREVWVSSFGNYQDRNPQYVPADSVAVYFTAESGDGLISVVSGTTDSIGNVSTVFTMGSLASRIRVDADGYGGGTPTSAAIEFSPSVEEWTLASSTSELSVSLLPNGPVDDLFPNAPRQLTADVVNTTWEVWTSNLGNTDYHSFAVPVAGLSVAFAVQSGDGTLTTTSGTTNAGGRATASFKMGTLSTIVRADVTDVGGVVRSGQIDFIAHVEQWTRGPDEATISTSVTTDGSTTEVPSGATRSITAQVMYTNWEVWTSDLGGIDKRYESAGAAYGASVTFSVDQGNGTVSVAGASTDADGKAYTAFTMDSQDSRVRADASYAGATSAGSLNFSRDPWTKQGSTSAVNLSFSVDPASSTVAASVSHETWEIWKKIPGGETENRNGTSGPAEGAAVSFSASGGISVGSSSGTTDITGHASTSYGGAQGASGVITVSASFLGGSGSSSCVVTIPLPPGPEPAPDPGPDPDPDPGPGPAPLIITTGSLGGTAGVAASGQLTATGGSGSYTWSPGGAGGLSWDETGAISGTPTIAGDFTASLSVSGGGMDSKTVPVTITAPPEPEPDPDPTPVINASSAASVGFSNDHRLHYVDADGESHAIDPDNQTPLVGPGSDSEAPAAVAYTKGSTPRTFAKLIVTRGTPSDDPLILDPSAVEWRLKANGVAIASGNSQLAVGGNVIDLGSHAFSAPLPSTLGKEMTNVTVDVRYTGNEITTPGWSSGGGANIPVYRTNANPVTPGGRAYAELLWMLYATMDDLIPDPAERINDFVELNFYYNPSSDRSTLNAFLQDSVPIDAGASLVTELGTANPAAPPHHHCGTHATVARYLAQTLGIHAVMSIYWGGSYNTIRHWKSTKQQDAWASVRALGRPVHEGATIADMDFLYHAFALISDTRIDPSYGLIEPNPVSSVLAIPPSLSSVSAVTSGSYNTYLTLPNRPPPTVSW